MKRTLSLIACAMVVMFICALFGCCADSSLPVIGIAQYAEHGSLDNCREGFITGLEQAGLVQGVDFELDYQNAGADDSINQQIAQNFASKNVDLVCAIATPSAVLCYSQAEEKNIPVVFTAVTDVESAGLSSGNVTGTSDKLPVTAQLELIRKIQPDAKTIGIIYTTSEPNSVSAIAEYKSNADKYGFTIEEIGVTSQAEVTQATDTLINKGVDCFSNLTDNNVVSVLGSVLEKTNDAKIPVYGSEVEQVTLGCVASAGINYFDLGKQTGEIAAKIFKGEAQASDIPYVSISEYDYYINSVTAKELGITFSDEIINMSIESTK